MQPPQLQNMMLVRLWLGCAVALNWSQLQIGVIESPFDHCLYLWVAQPFRYRWVRAAPAFVEHIMQQCSRSPDERLQFGDSQRVQLFLGVGLDEPQPDIG